MNGRVFVGQKCCRGVAGQKTVTNQGFKNIDVTSASLNLLGSDRIPAKTLSPLTIGPIVDKEGNHAATFEAFWQHSKYWPSAGHLDARGAPTQKWFDFRKKGFALSKGKRRPLPLARYGRPTGAIYNGKVYTGVDGYVASRSDIYVPLYANLIRDTPAVDAMRKMVQNGESIMIIDGDGPPRSIYPNGMEMNVENWRRMISDPQPAFGHGFVVAAVVAGLELPELSVESAQKQLQPKRRKLDVGERGESEKE